MSGNPYRRSEVGCVPISSDWEPHDHFLTLEDINNSQLHGRDRIVAVGHIANPNIEGINAGAVLAAGFAISLFRQTFARGLPTSPLTELGATQNRRGTMLAFTPDPQIFGAEARFKPARLYRLARSKAYLFAGVEIRWRCDPDLADEEVPEEAVTWTRLAGNCSLGNWIASNKHRAHPQSRSQDHSHVVGP